MVFFSNLAFNFVFSASLNQLWAMVNTQQLIVLMPLFRVNIPANAGSLFAQIMQIAAFEIIEIGEFLDELLGIPSTSPMNKNFAAIGLDSIYLLNNMGTLSIAYILLLLLSLFTISLKAFGKLNKWIYWVHVQLKEALFYRPLISLFFESYSLLTVCGLINMTKLSFESLGMRLHTITCLVVLVCIFLIPALMLRYLVKNFNRLNDRIIKRKYGKMYDELNIRGSKVVLVQPFFFLLRRLMLAVAIVNMQKVLIWQIMVMSSQIVASVIIIGNVRPYKLSQTRKVETLNEVLLMFVMYTILCFSPFVPDVQVRFSIGYICVGAILSHLAVNFVIIGIQTYQEMRMKWIKRFAKRTYKKNRLLHKQKIKKQHPL